jgi:uncharacterized protein (TIGR00730 family)
MSIQAVTVYCSSSRRVDRIFFEAAGELGRAIATAGWRLVYGGNRTGPMGALADAARAAGGSVTGITPQLLVNKGIADDQCHELIVTSSMRQRKELLEQHGDAFVALPGGLGTLEEVFEIIVGRQLDVHAKPIVLLNIDGFYQPLLSMIEQGISRQFIKPEIRPLYFVAGKVRDAMIHLRQWSST